MHRRRGSTRLRTAAALAVWAALLLGCVKPSVMTQVDYIDRNLVTGEIVDGSEFDAFAANVPPPIVTDPARPCEWHLTLEEVLQIGLEGNQQIRLLAYQPAEAGTAVDAELAAFDPFLESNAAFRRNRPIVTRFTDITSTQSLFSPGSGNTLGISKRNATGGLTSIGFNLNSPYSDPDDPTALFSRQWDSSLTGSIEQPILQGAGVEFNRSLILIARANHKQSQQQFEAAVRSLLRDIERTYWDLCFAYENLRSREIGLEMALALWQSEKAKREEGAGARPDVAQARQQFEAFRDERLLALNQVLEVEAALRQLLGLPPQDDRRIIPADSPVTAEVVPCWDVCIAEAQQFRPELNGQRLVIRAAELDLQRLQNALLPELSFVGSYGRLGAAGSVDKSIDSFGKDNFDDWTVGLRFRAPLGERAAHSAARRAELALMRERAALHNLQQTILYELQRSYRAIHTQFQSMQIRESRLNAAAEFLDAQVEFLRQGQTTVFVALEAQSRYADALRDRALALTQYNQALIEWEYARGTILQSDNVVLGEYESLPTDETLRLARWRRAARSVRLPLPLGSIPHHDTYPCQDSSVHCPPPLYRTDLYDRFGRLEPCSEPENLPVDDSTLESIEPAIDPIR